MLGHYYDLRHASHFEDLFSGTYISEHPTQEHNQYMVLRFDFSGMVMSDNIAGLELNFNQLNCIPIDNLATGPNHYGYLFPDFRFSMPGDATKMLEDVLGFVQRNNFPPVYILIDEYDSFTNQLLTAYKDPLYEEITTSDSFLRTFFKVIKKGIGEGSVRTCFCAGVLPVTMDDLTSGYNIAEILTLKSDFLSMLGFIHAEAETYLRYVLKKYTGSEERFDEVWQLIISNYDGYRFQPDAEQVKEYARTILAKFPYYQIRTYVLYVVANKGYRFWEVQRSTSD